MILGYLPISFYGTFLTFFVSLPKTQALEVWIHIGWCEFKKAWQNVKLKRQALLTLAY